MDNRDYLKTFSSNSVDLIITSPPYNIGKEYEKVKSIGDWVVDQSNIISECHRVLKTTGSICWQTGNYVTDGEIFPLDSLLLSIFHKNGFKLRNRIVWHFEHGLHCKKRLSGRYEVISWFTKSNQYTFNLDPIRIPQKYPNKKAYKGPNAGLPSCNPLGKNPGDVWIIPNVKSNHVEKTEHPCQFPIELTERLILSLSNQNDVVLDPYVGVGTTVIAAEKHGRVGYGCDIVTEYVEIANQRLYQLKEGVLPYREMFKPVFEPKILDMTQRTRCTKDA